MDEIYDLIALRVLVPTVADCYHALGIVHQVWMPLPGRFDDYIAQGEVQRLSIFAYKSDWADRGAAGNPNPHD